MEIQNTVRDFPRIVSHHHCKCFNVIYYLNVEHNTYKIIVNVQSHYYYILVQSRGSVCLGILNGTEAGLQTYNVIGGMIKAFIF